MLLRPWRPVSSSASRPKRLTAGVRSAQTLGRKSTSNAAACCLRLRCQKSLARDAARPGNGSLKQIHGKASVCYPSLSRIGANAETEPVGGAPQQEQPRRDELLDNQFVEPAADGELPPSSAVSRAAGTVTAVAPRRVGSSAQSGCRVSLPHHAGAPSRRLTVAA